MNQSLNSMIRIFLPLFLSTTLFAQPLTNQDMIYKTVVNSRNYSLFVPKGTTTIRGIIFRGPGLGGSSLAIVDDPIYHYFAKRFNFGVLGYDNGDIITNDCIAALKTFGQMSTIPTIGTAPIYAEGFSNGGGNTWSWVKTVPDKVIGYFVDKGVSSSGIATDPGLGVPGMNVHGELESVDLINNQARLFSNTRSRGGLIGMVVQEGADHREGDEYRLLSNPFLYQIEKVRNPKGALPLSPMAESNGWLGDTSTRHDPMMKIYSYDTYPSSKNKRDACWFPNKDMAYTFAAFCTFSKKLNLAAVTVPPVPGKIGDSARFSVTVNSVIGSIKQIDFYDYSVKVGQVGPNDPKFFTFKNLGGGVHNFLAIAINQSDIPYISNSYTVYIEGAETVKNRDYLISSKRIMPALARYSAPTRAILVNASAFEGPIAAMLFATNGTVVKQLNIQGEGIKQVDIGLLRPGIYLLRLKTNEKEYQTSIPIW